MLWSEYAKKQSAPADTDELIQLESESGTNKTIQLLYFFEWIIEKVKGQEFSVNTADRTVEGAINEIKTTTDATKNSLPNKADGKGISFSVSQTGNLQVTYDDGK